MSEFKLPFDISDLHQIILIIGERYKTSQVTKAIEGIKGISNVKLLNPFTVSVNAYVDFIWKQEEGDSVSRLYDTFISMITEYIDCSAAEFSSLITAEDSETGICFIEFKEFLDDLIEIDPDMSMAMAFDAIFDEYARRDPEDIYKFEQKIILEEGKTRTYRADKQHLAGASYFNDSYNSGIPPITRDIYAGFEEYDPYLKALKFNYETDRGIISLLISIDPKVDVKERIYLSAYNGVICKIHEFCGDDSLISTIRGRADDYINRSVVRFDITNISRVYRDQSIKKDFDLISSLKKDQLSERQGSTSLYNASLYTAFTKITEDIEKLSCYVK